MGSWSAKTWTVSSPALRISTIARRFGLVRASSSSSTRRELLADTSTERIVAPVLR